MKIFLGGTTFENLEDDFRKFVEKYLNDNSIDYFNPIVDDWTPECVEVETIQKDDLCDTHLFVITSQMRGVYSIAELMDSSYDIRKRTIALILSNGFDKYQLRSLQATIELANRNGKFTTAKIIDDKDLIEELDKAINETEFKPVNYLDDFYRDENSTYYDLAQQFIERDKNATIDLVYALIENSEYEDKKEILNMCSRMNGFEV